MKIQTIINAILYKINLRVSRSFPRPFQKYNLMDKENLVGVEVGVFKGENAHSLLKRSSIAKLYLIDPYKACKFHFSVGYPDKIALKKAEEKAKNKLGGFQDKTIWIKKKSDDAVKDIPNNLDFVYIDGNNDSDFVKRDIENYYLKLKQGGVLAGFIGNLLAGHILKIVIEFAVKNNLNLFVKTPDWWVIKK